MIRWHSSWSCRAGLEIDIVSHSFHKSSGGHNPNHPSMGQCGACLGIELTVSSPGVLGRVFPLICSLSLASHVLFSFTSPPSSSAPSAPSPTPSLVPRPLPLEEPPSSPSVTFRDYKERFCEQQRAGHTSPNYEGTAGEYWRRGKSENDTSLHGSLRDGSRNVYQSRF